MRSTIVTTLIVFHCGVIPLALSINDKTSSHINSIDLPLASGITTPESYIVEKVFSATEDASVSEKGIFKGYTSTDGASLYTKSDGASSETRDNDLNNITKRTRYSDEIEDVVILRESGVQPPFFESPKMINRSPLKHKIHIKKKIWHNSDKEHRPIPFINKISFEFLHDVSAEEEVFEYSTRVDVAVKILKGFSLWNNNTVNRCLSNQSIDKIAEDVATEEPIKFFATLLAVIVNARDCKIGWNHIIPFNGHVIDILLDPGQVCYKKRKNEMRELCAENLLHLLVDHWDNSVIQDYSLSSGEILINQKRCVNYRTLSESLEETRGHHHGNHLQSILLYRLAQSLVLSLNKGYDIALMGRPCELAFVEDIFRNYGENSEFLKDQIISEKKLSNILEDMVKERRNPDVSKSVSRNVFLNTKRSRRSIPQDKVGIFNASDIMKIFKIQGNGVGIGDFYEICPALIQEVLTIKRNSIPATSSPENMSNTTGILTTAEMYGYGTVAVSIISIMSVFGAVVMKAAKGIVRQYVMASLLALAVGNLCGDALLHLLPEVLVGDGEDENGDGLATGEILLLGRTDMSIASSRMLAVLASIYIFFILELVMSIYHTHDHNIEIDVLEKGKKVPVEDQPSQVNNGASCSNSIDNCVDLGKEERDNIANAHLAPKSLAWMIVVGDAIHNFADGLAIGAAFSGQLSSGLSTSIAVICHELPHELGDFAVLVSTGMSIKKALLLNFVSSLTAFAGLYVGIAVGELEQATEWIFLVGAGMFLYVALANLLPELQRYFHEHRTWQMFISQNLGILSGYSAMLLIAIYEDEI